jgi:DNA-binding IclR family transcriptional regulator
LLEALETAYESGASLADLAIATGIPRSTLQRRLSRPGLFAGKVTDPELAAELDALRRARLAEARERADSMQAAVDAAPAMAAEFEEAVAMTRLDSDLARIGTLDD